MSDGKPKYAHATSADGPWRPVDVDSPEAAAREAVHAWAHEHPEIVLVGMADWQTSEDLARLADPARLVRELDERIYEMWPDGPCFHSEVGQADMEKLAERLEYALAPWIDGLGYPGFFVVREWTEWRVVQWPEKDGGPEVERIEQTDYSDDEIPF